MEPVFGISPVSTGVVRVIRGVFQALSSVLIVFWWLILLLFLPVWSYSLLLSSSFPILRHSLTAQELNCFHITTSMMYHLLEAAMGR